MCQFFTFFLFKRAENIMWPALVSPLLLFGQKKQAPKSQIKHVLMVFWFVLFHHFRWLYFHKIWYDMISYMLTQLYEIVNWQCQCVKAVKNKFLTAEDIFSINYWGKIGQISCLKYLISFNCHTCRVEDGVKALNVFLNIFSFASQPSPTWNLDSHFEFKTNSQWQFLS